MHKAIHQSTRGGFSLTELLVGLVLISIIAVAVGLAMHHSSKRVSDTKAVLTYWEQEKGALASVVDNLRWADQIILLESDNIRFTVPKSDGSGSSPVCEYFWDSDDHKLYYSDQGDPPVAVLSQVQFFDIKANYYVEGGEDHKHIRSLKIIVELNRQEEELIERKLVHLINLPLEPED